MSREDASLVLLECKKVAVLKYKAKRASQADAESAEAKQAAKAVRVEALDRCLKARGWTKNE